MWQGTLLQGTVGSQQSSRQGNERDLQKAELSISPEANYPDRSSKALNSSRLRVSS